MTPVVLSSSFILASWGALGPAPGATAGHAADGVGDVPAVIELWGARICLDERATDCSFRLPATKVEPDELHARAARVELPERFATATHSGANGPPDVSSDTRDGLAGRLQRMAAGLLRGFGGAKGEAPARSDGA